MTTVSEWWKSAEGIKGALAGKVGAPSDDDLPGVFALAWASFAVLFFGGQLPRVCVEVVVVPQKLVSRWEPGGRDGVGRVVLGRRVTVVFSWAVARLLHEAVRAYCATAQGDSEPGYSGHGLIFCAVANRVGALLDVPKVAPKSRGGAKASDWPLARPEAVTPAEVARAVLLPVERVELEALRVELRAVYVTLDVLRGELLARDDGARRRLFGVLGRVRKYAAGVERSRVAVLRVSASGGKAATARELSRVLAELVDDLAGAVAGDVEALRALGRP